MSLLTACLLLAVTCVGWLVLATLHFSWIVSWTEKQTADGVFFLASARHRCRVRARLKRHASILRPYVWLLSQGQPFRFENSAVKHTGVAFPRGMCDENSISRATQYQPTGDDVFVVTQMKCGTTWMQHLVYQILCRGQGDLAASDQPLNAVSPWLESNKTVRVEEAPLLGAAARRIIKTHLPSVLCPIEPQARYIYVTRHPVSCFASCTDFLRSSLGPLAPRAEAIESWFLSDQMWFGSWKSHVDGWLAARRDGLPILVVSFESMKLDIGVVAQRIAQWLDQPTLSTEELSKIEQKCSFAWMRDHADIFEMQPPNLLHSASRYFVSGQSDRHLDVPAEVAERIQSWAGDTLDRLIAAVADESDEASASITARC